MKVVGVIGAGPAGLCAARHIQATEGMTAIVWEQSGQLGGQWRLSKDVGTDANGFPVHSSIYEGLRTDLPKLIMKFPDLEFPPGVESFVRHTEVLQYLEHYAAHHALTPLIKFGTRVEDVSPIPQHDGATCWAVTVKDLASGVVTTMTCDAVLVCNGHFSVPRMPEIEDEMAFEGRRLHSHDYREPSALRGRRVVVLGSGASGLDIAMELSTVAEEVFLSHNFPFSIPSEFPANVRQVSGVVRATEDGFVLQDGKTIKADTIIYCTGYHYNFPFLSEECNITVEDNQVKHLYKHIFNASYPTMGFIGIPSRIIVFPLLHYQVQYFLATLSEKILLPTSDTMIKAVEYHAEERRKQGWPNKHYHILQDDQFPYMEELAEGAGIDPPPEYLQEVWKTVITRLLMSFPEFKKYTYSINQDGSLKETKDGMILKTSWDLKILMGQQTVRLLWRDFYKIMYLLYTQFMASVYGYFGWDYDAKKGL